MKFEMPGAKRVVFAVGFIVALIAGVAPVAGSKPQSAATPPAARRDPGSKPRLQKPEYLPEQARVLLRSRMERHGDDMMMLMATVLMLRYEATEELALNIAREPKLVRPGPGDLDILNQSLPPRFFDLQAQLSERAQSVADAAKIRDDAKVVRAYGRLAETCVACHSTYFHGAQ